MLLQVGFEVSKILSYFELAASASCLWLVAWDASSQLFQVSRLLLGPHRP